MKETIILTTLKKSIKEKTIISVYSDINNSDNFSCGFVEAISDEHILIQSVNKYGLYGGYVIRRVDGIFRIDDNGDYEKKLCALYNIQQQEHNGLLKNELTKDDNLIIEALKSAMINKYVISIYIFSSEQEGEDLSGWVRSLSDSEIVISKISYYGHDDGVAVIQLSNIYKIDCDTDYEISLRLLNNNKSK